MYLITPLKNEIVGKLKVGDVVYVSGRIYTARDKAHDRALKEGRFPAELKGAVIFHSGPIAKKEGGKWKIVSIGPTTSSRMNGVEPDFLERFDVKAVIGKGGMSGKVVEAMKGRAVYLSMTGGCAAVSAKQVKDVAGVEWLDLGMPEAVWILDVEKLGPLIVTIDSKGNSLHEEVGKEAKRNLKGIIDAL